ncbi:MAG: transglycosylase domain-containing protein, partial [Clostridia bacterium]|nr:transglycosylase domain-containing protein [Clostridia bacterium]
MFSNKTEFDINKIKHSQINLNLYDNQNRPIEETNKAVCFVNLNTLPKHTKQCFISIEDKNFYEHNGLNYKRMAGAMLKNIKAMKIKEGASTISQQLIKNTHLSSEKTFTRKFNEILLTKQLEKILSKDEILEYYLNVIYFGDNCYGIENASQHYFSKPAKQLNLLESATLAGMIKAPNIYSPIKNSQKSLERRNVVLYELYQDNKINFQDYIKLKSSPLETNVSNPKDEFHNSYSQACYEEASRILKMPEKQIAIGEYKIYTYFNKEKQETLKQAIKQYDFDYDCSAISMTKTGEIEAYVGKSNLKIIDIKRQPGSAIKPILVYAPAINENIISPLTQINDEKIDIDGYSPSNVSNKYNGYISVRDCVAKSLNVPAVKTLSYVGVEKAKNYAKMCNIEFDGNDNNLSLALGGMTYGTSLKQLTNSYTALA